MRELAIHHFSILVSPRGRTAAGGLRPWTTPHDGNACDTRDCGREEREWRQRPRTDGRTRPAADAGAQFNNILGGAARSPVVGTLRRSLPRPPVRIRGDEGMWIAHRATGREGERELA